MKKMISVMITLGLVSILYQFFVLLVMNKHNCEYSIKTEDSSYMINESFHKKNESNIYFLSIKDKDNKTFVTSYDKNLNRQSRIIKDIQSYNNHINCIAPVLKNKEIENILCMLDNQLVSTTYLHQIGNKDINTFMNQLKEKGYQINDKTDDTDMITKTESNLSLYNNLPENLHLSVWGYHGIYAINKDNIEFRDLLDKDEYFNNYGILAGKYYILLKTDDSTYSSFILTNVKDGGKSTIETEFEFSKNSYFNGIYKGNAYFTDIDNKKQYIVNPKRENVKEVGISKESKFYDGEKLINVNISELVNEKKYFIPKKIDEKVQNKYPNISLKESNGSYYYLEDGNVYQIIGNYLEEKVLLFHFNDYKEWKVINNHVYGISGDTIYSYDYYNGLKKILSNREFNYNYSNSYDIYEVK